MKIRNEDMRIHVIRNGINSIAVINQGEIAHKDVHSTAITLCIIIMRLQKFEFYR